MKQLLYFIIALFAINNQAQTEQGNWLIRGESAFSGNSINKTKTSDDGDEDLGKETIIQFTPQVGVFVIENLAIGASISLQYAKEKEEDGTEFIIQQHVFGPFARYYFLENNVKPYLSASTEFGKRKANLNTDSGDNETSYSVVMSQFGGGLAIFMNEKVAADIGVNYMIQRNKKKEDNINNEINHFKGIRFRIGFSIFL